MDLKQVLIDFTNVLGASGSEFSASELFEERIKPFADETEKDAFANVCAIKRSGKKDAPLLMLDAHIDQLAMMVSDITEDGFVRFIAPGFDPRQLYGADVTLVTRNAERIPGIVTTIPIELQYERVTKTIPVRELSVDLGLPADRVKKLVAVGDPVYYANETCELADGTLAGRAFDDRAGVAAILYAAEKLKDERLNCDVLYCATAREEVGGPGAAIVAYKYEPLLAVVLDGTHAKCHVYSGADAFEFGDGVIIGMGDHSSPRFARMFAEIARAKEIPHKIQPIPAHSKTNAARIQYAGKGVETVVLSFPMRYAHSPVEMVCEKDVENLAKLLTDFAKIYDGGVR